MCDYSEAESLSLYSVGVSKHFCLHVIFIDKSVGRGGWRWVEDHKHGLTDCESVPLLGLVRDCSSSSAPPSPWNQQITK